MKTRDIKALHTKSIEELRSLLRENRETPTSSRLEYAQQKLANTTSLANVRRDIARIQTVLRLKADETPVEGTDGAEKTVKKGGKS